MMNIGKEKKEMNSEVEDEYRNIVKARKQMSQDEIERRAEVLNKPIPSKFPKHYRISLTNDSTLYYASLFNQILVNEINKILLYNDEYIIHQSSSLLQLQSKQEQTIYESKWINYLNVA